MPAPIVEKTAGAEAIFWRVHVWDEIIGQDWQRKLVTYVRVKVFDEKGKEKVSSIEIPYGGDISVTSIEGRTIKPDGTIVLLKKEDIHEREVLRLSGTRRKVKSFAMPAVEPGAIIEYKYRETHFKQDIRYLNATMQHEFPIQKVTYFVKPLSSDYIGMRMRVWPFNCKNSPLNLMPSGFTATSVENMPSFEEEPDMPGILNVRAWILFFYMEDGRRDVQKYWEKKGKDVYSALRASLKVNDELKAISLKAVENAGEDEKKKAEALIDYVRKNVRNLYDRSVTDAERAKILKSIRGKEGARTSVEVFKTGIGTADELNTLFAAMAQAAGLEARPVLVANRRNIAFSPELTDTYFLNNIDMALKVGETWKVYDVAARDLPPDMISWDEEGMPALLSDPKKPVFLSMPLSPPESSATTRNGKFTLDEIGTLEGDVELRFTGHSAAARRLDTGEESHEQRSESIRKMVLTTFPSAEVTEIKVDGLNESSKPLSYRYHVKIPGFAQRTGKRLLFSPLFFQLGIPPRFPSSERKFDVHFRYAWKEDDRVHIQLPDGFDLDSPENPGGLNFGEPGYYDLQMSVTADRELQVVRKFMFGRGGHVALPRESYEQMRNVFNQVHRRDGVAISLRQKGL